MYGVLMGKIHVQNWMLKWMLIYVLNKYSNISHSYRLTYKDTNLSKFTEAHLNRRILFQISAAQSPPYPLILFDKNKQLWMSLNTVNGSAFNSVGFLTAAGDSNVLVMCLCQIAKQSQDLQNRAAPHTYTRILCILALHCFWYSKYACLWYL